MEEELTGHTDWVRDVAWAPSIGMPGTHIATCSQVSDNRGSELRTLTRPGAQDRTVLIHYKATPDAQWTTTPLYPNADSNDPKFPDAVWKLSWRCA